MEELRSTEILDKEIKADARKKAEKLLSKADVDCQYILSEVEKRIASARAEFEAHNGAMLSALESDLKASLPLEKQRFQVAFVQRSMDAAMNAYLSSLDEEKQLLLALSLLQKKRAVTEGRSFTAYVYGFAKKAVEKQLTKEVNVASIIDTEFNKVAVENDCGVEDKKGVILESEDRAVRLRLTLSEWASQLEESYRAELCQALFGGRL